jgi:P-type Cu2+ transporter
MTSTNLPISALHTPAPGRDVVYTCPMHSQIRLPNPGSCPICGMTLELVTPAATEESSTELTSMTRRFWVALVLSVPLLWLTMGHDLRLPDLNGVINHLAASLRLPHLESVSWAQYAQALLATPVVVGGLAVFRAGLEIVYDLAVEYV